jgi:hypothetical protein
LSLRATQQIERISQEYLCSECVQLAPIVPHNAELADFSRLTFVDSRLPARDIPRHCTEDELAQDPDYARSQ